MKKTIVTICLILAMTATAFSAEKKIKKEKLQVFILMGQSNMVGLADVSTFQYLLQEPFLPTFKEVEPFMKMGARYSNIFSDFGFEFGNEFYSNPEKNFNTNEWSRKWKFRKLLLDSMPEDQRVTPQDIYKDMMDRTRARMKYRPKMIERYIKGTTEADFEGLNALKRAARDTPEAKIDRRNERLAYAKSVQKQIGLPIAKRTYIAGYGAFDALDSLNNDNITRYANGPLSVGWGGRYSTIGPEYGFGIAMEEMVDAPILIIKCAWGNTQLCAAWRSPSNPKRKETAEERKLRDRVNAMAKAKAEKEGKEFVPKKAPDYSKDSFCWKVVKFQDHITKVLSDLGKYHPEYDPAKGYDVAGMLWFQGHSDGVDYKNGKEYKENMKYLINDVRKLVRTPKMPVVIGTVSTDLHKPRIDFSLVVQSQLAVAQMPQFKGNVTTVNTTKFYPTELEALKTVSKLIGKPAEKAIKEGKPYDTKGYEMIKGWRKYKGISNAGYHYMGSAECFVQMSDAFAMAMVDLMKKK